MVSYCDQTVGNSKYPVNNLITRVKIVLNGNLFKTGWLREYEKITISYNKPVALLIILSTLNMHSNASQILLHCLVIILTILTIYARSLLLSDCLL